jgi:hypothetical protein
MRGIYARAGSGTGRGPNFTIALRMKRVKRLSDISSCPRSLNKIFAGVYFALQAKRCSKYTRRDANSKIENNAATRAMN